MSSTKPLLIKNSKDDKFFISACDFVALNSTCIKAKVGAVIVSEKENISSGWNRTAGNIHNCKNANKYYHNFNHSDYHDKYEIHAEMDVILNFKTDNPEDTLEGATLYCTLKPCWNCTKYIIETGIKRIVFSDYKKPRNNTDDFEWIICLQQANIDWQKIERKK